MAGVSNMIPHLLVLSALVTSGHAQITIDVTGCGTTKGCMRSPDDCTQDTCDLLVTWTSTASGIDFEMSGTSDGYIALSIAPTNKMAGGSITACIRSSADVMSVETRYNDGYSNIAITPSNAALSSEVAAYTTDKVACTFTRALTNADSQVLDIDQGYYLIFATGSVSGSSITKHSSTPTASDSTIELTSTDYQNIGGSASVSNLVRVHGIFMLNAWLLLAPAAYMIASYFKERGFPVGGETLCGQKPWFSLHRSMMIPVLFFSAIAFILIFVHAKRWSTFGDSWDDSHAIIGTIVTILVIVNPLMAAIRPAPDSEKRFIFNICHKAVGICAVYLAIVNIMSGLQLAPAATFAPKATIYCIYAFLGVNGVCHIILGVERGFWDRDRRNKSCKQSGAGMSDLGSKSKVAPDDGGAGSKVASDDGGDESKVAPDGEDAGKGEDGKPVRQKFIFGVLVVYGVVTFGLWFAVLVMILA